MKIMIDTNVIISSLLKQGSVPDIVLNYVCNNHDLILCDHIKVLFLRTMLHF